MWIEYVRNQVATLLALNAIGVAEAHIVKKIAQLGKQRVMTAKSVDISVPAAGQARFLP